MVPALLALHNFLCYGETCPPIDFTGIHVACLTGENGNGKSAILDAITWALWGQARAHTDDELIHLGRTEMEVEFEFWMGEQRYRVIRKRKKGTQRSSGTTALEFHLAGLDGWKPLTANHVRDTELAIKTVIKLDYETFINSALLIQGRADEFTLKAPGERKRILAEILGLSIYDELEKQARYERELRNDAVRALERETEDIERALLQEPAYNEERSQIAAALSATEGELTRQGELLSSLREAERLIELQRQQADHAARAFQEAAAQVERESRRVEEHRRRIERHETVVREAVTIRSGFQRLQDARVQEQEFSRRQATLAGLERRSAVLAAAVEKARMQLLSDERQLDSDVARLTAAAAPRGELRVERERIQQQLGFLETDASRLEGLRQDEQEEREVISALNSENRRLRDEMDAIKGKQTELSTTTVCPLCQTELGAGGQAHIVDAYQQQGSQLAAQFRQNRTRIQEREARANGQRNEIARLDKDVQERRTRLSHENGAIERKLQEVEEADKLLPERQSALAALRDRLAQGDYARDEAQELATLADEIDKAGYDEDAHERVRATIEAAAPFEQRQRELDLAEAQLVGERAALESAEAALAEWQVQLGRRKEEAERLQAAVQSHPQSAGRLAELQAACEQLQQQQRRLQQAMGAIEQKLDDCARLRLQRDDKAAKLKREALERQVYEELTVAFSKRGIQALLIDRALPEITEEANRLLGRMTNNRMQVMMDTQRQTQKGTLTETLDIRIADELGTRNYELFSGGEAFRVNLALRIALSKVLARRAGAPLPTLVIDEGFGSQDAAARERLIEALNVIQSDFQCLLVITHLEELKDQFPVHIEVVKTPDGSIATVVA